MTQIVPLVERQTKLTQFFESRKGHIGMALARVGVTPDQIIRAFFTSAQKTPRLLECTPESAYKAVLLSAQAGLIPDGVSQQAHLIPRANRSRKGPDGKPIEIMECNVQIGYRGYLTLCRRSGEVDVISAYLVREGDEFGVVDGVPKHTPLKRNGFPALNGADGKERPIVGVWAKAVFKSGATDYEWMSREEIEAIRRRSNAASDAWTTDYGEMAKKTILRRICKRLPQSESSARLLDLDAKAEAGLAQDIEDIEIAMPTPVTVTDVPQEPAKTATPHTDEKQGKLDEDPEWR